MIEFDAIRFGLPDIACADALGKDWQIHEPSKQRRAANRAPEPPFAFLVRLHSLTITSARNDEKNGVNSMSTQNTMMKNTKPIMPMKFYASLAIQT